MPAVTAHLEPNPVFLRNMAQLWRLDARLAQQIDELPLDAALDLQPSKAGPPTARVSTADGRTLYLHSRYDPHREAREFCDTLEKTDAACVILCGLGLGYHLQALFDAFGPDVVYLISEPDLVTIKTALEQTDLSAPLAAGRIAFINRLDKGFLHERIMHFSTILMLGTLFAVPPVARDHQSEFHAACRTALLDFAAFAKMSLVTLVRNASITCRNIAANLPTYVSTPPIDILRNRFAGCPAILVAAGPSLARNIDQLVALQDKAIIIAAQTTLRPLLERGIRPHFVTSLDFSDLSRQFFENLEIPGDLVLVAEPKASWHVIDAFRADVPGTVKQDPQSLNPSIPHSLRKNRRLILLDNAFARRCVGDGLAQRSPLEAGATVMHLAFYLAQWLGCDPIIFVGQDLAFGGHCYYTPGVAMHRAWAPELGRFTTLEMKEWERIARHRAILRKVKDINGRDIYTDDQMFTYLEQFERDFAKSAARVIDATEGGARKAGTTIMKLADAAGQFCRSTIDAAKFDYLRHPWGDAGQLHPARDALAARRKELDKFESLCRETRDILNELTDLVGDSSAFNRRIARVDELRTLVQDHETIFAMVRDVSQLGELQRLAADRKLHAPEGGDQARAQRQIQRDIQFIDAMLEGCKELGGILDHSLHRFDAAIEATK
ncbi:MAG TPA: 6-hydroxymethylpterin diphosphokinase MptE-like protein [Phycisphaerae bacterium]|nr:6-hydroxymethylpterin diphosphokinase MptE-like protein [Phycisphaerae bacterium]